MLLSYLVLFVAFGSALILALASMSDTQKRLLLLKEGYLPVAKEVSGAEAIPLGLQLKAGQDVEVLNSVSRTESEFLALKKQRLGKAMSLLEALQQVPFASDEVEDLRSLQNQLAAVQGSLEAYERTHMTFLQAMEEGEPAGGFVPDLVGLKSEVLVRLKRISGRVDRKVARVVAATELAQRSAPRVILPIASGALVLGLLLLVTMNRHLRPIRQLITSAERLRAGELTERVAVEGRDDIGRLARSFNAMAKALQERERHLQVRSAELESALSDLRRSQEAGLRNARLATIGQMAAQIAHEVRNPLNALGLNAEMLVDEVESGNADIALELIAAIRAEVRRLTDITESYLELGRLPPLRLERSSLAELVGDTLRFQGEEIGQAGVELKSDVPGTLPEVLIDAAQLRQALLNIVRNATEALRASGGGLLAVSAEAFGDEVRLNFADDGPGIAGDVATKIFDPFFSTKKSGSGLGLPLTHQVISEHGGRIECRSTPGEGTTFSIWLPVASPEETRSS